MPKRALGLVGECVCAARASTRHRTSCLRPTCRTELLLPPSQPHLSCRTELLLPPSQPHLSLLQAAQAELGKAAQDFRRLHEERQELLEQWEGVLKAISKRDASILEAGGSGMGRETGRGRRPSPAARAFEALTGWQGGKEHSGEQQARAAPWQADTMGGPLPLLVSFPPPLQASTWLRAWRAWRSCSRSWRRRSGSSMLRQRQVGGGSCGWVWKRIVPPCCVRCICMLLVRIPPDGPAVSTVPTANAGGPAGNAAQRRILAQERGIKGQYDAYASAQVAGGWNGGAPACLGTHDGGVVISQDILIIF